MANGLTKAEQELETKEASDQRRRGKDKAQKLQVYELVGGLGVGVLYGVAETKMPTLLSGFGPKKKLNLNIVLALGGGYMSFKSKGKAREIGSAAAVVGLSKIGESWGRKMVAG